MILEKLLIYEKDKALKYLTRDKLKYMGIIFPILRNTVEFIYSEKDGVFIRDVISNVYMLALDNFEKSRKLLDSVSKINHICLYNKDIAEYYHEKFVHKKYAINIQAVYKGLKKVNLNSPILNIKPLTIEQLNWLHIHNGHDLNYLAKRLEAGAIYGGYINNDICCSIGIHADGSIGMLVVLKNYRRQGYAIELERYLINTLIDRGHTPFSQIEYDNIASICLHKKLGFEISKDMLYRLID